MLGGSRAVEEKVSMSVLPFGLWIHQGIEGSSEAVWEARAFSRVESCSSSRVEAWSPSKGGACLMEKNPAVVRKGSYLWEVKGRAYLSSGRRYVVLRVGEMVLSMAMEDVLDLTAGMLRDIDVMVLKS